jgi:hypothetical protein
MCTGGLNMRISNSHIRTGQELHDSSHTLQQHVWSCSTSCLHTILMTGRYSFCIQWLFIIAETLQKLGDCQALNPYQQVFWWILKKSGLGFCVCVCVCVFFGWGALGCQPGKHSDMVTSKICETRRSFNKHLLVQIVAMVFDLLLGSFLPPPAPLIQNCYCLASLSLN